MLNVGFYADFVPISYSQDNQAPISDEAYNAHRGYEADLLTAMEALERAGLSFSRRGIAPVETPAGRTFPFAGTWLLAAELDFDLITGGITIRDDRTLNAAGQQVVSFTSGHVAFRQSLLVRREDAQRIAEHGDLAEGDVVSVHRGTTGEEPVAAAGGHRGRQRRFGGWHAGDHAGGNIDRGRQRSLTRSLPPRLRPDWLIVRPSSRLHRFLR